MDYKFKESVAPVKQIASIQFGLLSPEYIRNVSVTQEQYDVTTGKQIPEGIYDQNNIYDQATKKPVLGGINDPRMGSILDAESPGYFGHINLAVPIYHYSFMQTILNILKSFSYWSSKLIIGEKELQFITKNVKKRKRLSEIVKIAQKIRVCKDTKKILPIFSRDGLKIIAEFPDQGIKRTLSTTEVYAIFEKISDDDTIKIGLNPKFCRPDNLLLKTFVVPPPHVRPTVSMGSSQKCEDDLTHKISDVLKANTALSKAIDDGSSATVIESFENLLQYHISTFFDNKIPGQKPSQQRSGKPLKTLRQRLVGKEGRVRGNLMGKRVDFSARSVITADPNLDMDQVGVPVHIAMGLTVPEKVNDYNIERLQALVNNGPSKHPGAKYVIIEKNRKIDLTYYKEPMILKVGYVVERHLDNDDIVLFNRQPSLHKMSIMGHRVKVQNYKTFRLNLAVVTPYNADFDGDEMNMHVPQSLTAMAEAENLMMVPYMIVSPQSNKPVMGIIQDSLLSSYLFTSRDTFFNRKQIMNCMSLLGSMTSKFESTLIEPAIRISKRLTRFVKNNKHFDGDEMKKRITIEPKASREDPSDTIELWTGKQVFSSILHTRINLRRTANGAPDTDTADTPSDTRVVISKGYLLTGRIDKKSIGTSEGSLVHTMYQDIGPFETMAFMNKLQKIANFWILNNGFTVGIHDTLINDYTKVHDILTQVKQRVNEIIKNTNTNDSKLEQEINSELNGARDEAGNYVQSSLSLDNHFKSTVMAGSKGNNLNISQIIACLGQQNIEGRRVPWSFKNRTLPHYEPNDMGYESRGFIENSYISALSPQEFFFHAMAGREGIIDTACKSVAWDTEIIVKDLNENLTKVIIGTWIDDLMSQYPDRVKKESPVSRGPDDMEMEILYLEFPMYIPTCDESGFTSWGTIRAVTRHLPTEYLYKIRTETGRDVVTADTESVLVYDPDKDQLVPRQSRLVKVGDLMPCDDCLCKPNCGIKTWNPVRQSKRMFNNVILEPVISCIRVPSDGKKVYDLTVNPTLNFMLANGLIVRDTSETGYTQRRVVKSLEDVAVRYDGTVRDSVNNIVQFMYGEDSADATFIETQEFKIINYTLAEMVSTFKHEQSSAKILDQEYQQLLEDRDLLRRVAMYRDCNNAKAKETKFPVPVNINRIMELRKYQVPIINQNDESEKLTPELIIQLVSQMLERLPRITKLFEIHVRSNLASKPLMQLATNGKLTRTHFEIILDEIELKYKSSFVNAGEMCGILAAQSISELTTQLTLNSFHSSGISTKNITLGLPRLKEIINISKKIKGPSLKLHIPNPDGSVQNSDIDITNRSLRNLSKSLRSYQFQRVILIKRNLLFSLKHIRNFDE
jgi:DNA-directed RNA polymerase beta' subunit